MPGHSLRRAACLQTMQIPMLAGESSPAAPGSSRSPVQNFSTLVPHSHPPRARPQAQQPGQPSSFTQPSSRLSRPGHGAGRAQPQTSQPQPLTYSFFPTDSIFNPGARGTSVTSSQAALSNGEGAPRFMPMGTGFGNDHVLSPRHQSPSMQHHQHSQLNGHLQQQQQQQQQLPHAAAQVRSPSTSQSQPFFLNGHLHQPAAHFQQQPQQQQLGGPLGGMPQGVMPQSGPRSPMHQSQQQAVTGTQRLQPMQQQQQQQRPQLAQQQPQQQQPQQRPQLMQQQQPVVQNGGPEAAGVGSPQPQQQQQPSRAASIDGHQLPGQSPLGDQPSGLKVVIPMAGRNRSEGQAPTDGRAQPGSATSVRTPSVPMSQAPVGIALGLPVGAQACAVMLTSPNSSCCGLHSCIAATTSSICGSIHSQEARQHAMEVSAAAWHFVRDSQTGTSS